MQPSTAQVLVTAHHSAGWWTVTHPPWGPLSPGTSENFLKTPSISLIHSFTAKVQTVDKASSSHNIKMVHIWRAAALHSRLHLQELNVSSTHPRGLRPASGGGRCSQLPWPWLIRLVQHHALGSWCATPSPPPHSPPLNEVCISSNPLGLTRWWSSHQKGWAGLKNGLPLKMLFLCHNAKIKIVLLSKKTFCSARDSVKISRSESLGNVSTNGHFPKVNNLASVWQKKSQLQSTASKKESH